MMRQRQVGTPPVSQNQSGLVLLVVLVFISVATLAASSMVVVYQQQTQREKEDQLLFAGDQIRRAIRAYYNAVPPSATKSYPPTLKALLNDTRFPVPVQHLRRLYVDPMTGAADWSLITEGTGIAGVYSRSNLPVIKQKGFPKDYQSFENKTSSRDWRFTAKSD